MGLQRVEPWLNSWTVNSCEVFELFQSIWGGSVLWAIVSMPVSCSGYAYFLQLWVYLLWWILDQRAEPSKQCLKGNRSIGRTLTDTLPGTGQCGLQTYSLGVASMPCLSSSHQGPAQSLAGSKWDSWRFGEGRGEFPERWVTACDGFFLLDRVLNCNSSSGCSLHVFTCSGAAGREVD